jgi:hypothetical protein
MGGEGGWREDGMGWDGMGGAVLAARRAVRSGRRGACEAGKVEAGARAAR